MSPSSSSMGGNMRRPLHALEGARLEREAREAESAARRVREIGRRAIDERVVMLRGPARPKNEGA